MASRLVTVPRGGSTSAGNWVNRPSTSGSNRLASSRSCTRITSAFLLSLPPHDDSANNLKGDRVDKISRGKIYTSTFSVLDRPSSCSLSFRSKRVGSSRKIRRGLGKEFNREEFSSIVSIERTFRVYWSESTEAEIYRSLPGPNIYNARNLSMRGHNFAPLSRNVIGLEIKQI